MQRRRNAEYATATRRAAERVAEMLDANARRGGDLTADWDEWPSVCRDELASLDELLRGLRAVYPEGEAPDESRDAAGEPTRGRDRPAASVLMREARSRRASAAWTSAERRARDAADAALSALASTPKTTFVAIDEDDDDGDAALDFPVAFVCHAVDVAASLCADRDAATDEAEAVFLITWAARVVVREIMTALASSAAPSEASDAAPSEASDAAPSETSDASPERS